MPTAADLAVQPGAVGVRHHADRDERQDRERRGGDSQGEIERALHAGRRRIEPGGAREAGVVGADQARARGDPECGRRRRAAHRGVEGGAGRACEERRRDARRRPRATRRTMQAEGEEPRRGADQRDERVLRRSGERERQGEQRAPRRDQRAHAHCPCRRRSARAEGNPARRIFAAADSTSYAARCSS